MEITSINLQQAINDIDITEPKQNGYLPWHHWRKKCVRRAIMILALKCKSFGYEVSFGNEYINISRDNRTLYIQYNELLHSYSTSAIHDYNIPCNDKMEITLSREEIDELFNEKADVYKKPQFFETKVINDQETMSYPLVYKAVHNEDFELLWTNMKLTRDQTFNDFCETLMKHCDYITLDTYKYLREKYNKLLYNNNNY